VRDVAVFGVADADLGDVPHAAVLGDVSASDLEAGARATMAGYKVPRRFHLLSELPRNAMGKVLKHELTRTLSPPTVRQSTADEAGRIAAWNVAMAAETEGVQLDLPTVEAGVRAVFQGRAGTFYLTCEVVDEAAGQLMVTREWSDWRNRWVYWIQSVYVHPDHRGRGVYTAMHQAVVDRARRDGAGGVRLYVDTTNHRAATVYAKVGMDGEHYQVFEQMFADEETR